MHRSAVLHAHAPIRAPCPAQPSRPAAAQPSRACWVAAVPADSANEPLGSPEQPQGAGSTTTSNGRQQQSQQLGSAPAWGSGWARPSSKAQKPVSYFSRPSKTDDKGSSSGSSGSRSSSVSGGTAATAAVPPTKLDAELEASIRQNVDRAAQTLQEVISEVLNELLIEEASAYVLDEAAPSIDLRQATRNALVKRLEWLDANFLAALNAYLAVPGVAANTELQGLLGTIRQELLDLVSARLPPSVQVLNTALGHSSKAGRARVVAAALSGGGGSLPSCGLDSLGAAAAQLVDDMEDQQVVADRVLLARLVLLREELRLRAEQQQAQQQFFTTTSNSQAAGNEGDAAQQGAASRDTPEQSRGSSGNRFFAFHRSNLPARCAAFMKELLLVPERDRRLGLIAKAFQEDWVGEAPPTPSQVHQQQQQAAAASSRGGLRDISSAHQATKPESLDIVRPGRFFSTLLAMRAELEQQLVTSGLGSGDAGEATLDLLRQLEAIRLEALVVLDRMQHHRPGDAEASSSSSSGGGGGRPEGSSLPDYELDLQ